MTSTPVRTRFAPSPTGSLHIGGARTAFLCKLFAKKHGGDFILRIEDTDQARNSAESLIGILDDLKWLGLDFAEGPDIEAVRRGELKDIGPHGPYFQSQRLDIYNSYLQKLLDMGRAYFAWETPEELAAQRNNAQPDEAYGHVRPKVLVTDENEAKRLAGGKPIMVRFVVPNVTVHVDDLVMGPTDFPPEHLNDFVIRKSDGMPTYHFAVVVDDALMQISHVIRAQEHFSNTPKHVALQQAFGLPTPAYAHLPLVFNSQGKKMSKREKDKVVKRFAKKWLGEKAGGNSLAVLAEQVQSALKDGPASEALTRQLDAWLKDPDLVIPQGAVREAIADVVGVPIAERPEIDVSDFKKAGFYSEAILNYIALLGWSPGTGEEIFTPEELVEAFNLEQVSKTNARFDRKKLVSFNLTHCNDDMSGDVVLKDKQLVAFKQYLESVGNARLLGIGDVKLRLLLEAKKGWRLYSDVEKVADPLFLPLSELRYDPVSVAKEGLNPGEPGRELLKGVTEVLKNQSEWGEAGLEAAVLGWCGERGLELKDIAPKIRVALTGTTVSPALWPSLVLVGREGVMERLEGFLRGV